MGDPDLVDPRPPVKPHSIVSSTNPWVHEGPTGHTGCGIIAGPFLVLGAIWGWIIFWAWFNDVIWDPMMSGLGF